MSRNYRATAYLTPPSGGDPVPVEAVFATFCEREYEPGTDHCCAGEPLWAEPHDGSAPLTNFVKGKVVFIQRGAVEFLVKAKHAHEAGASGVIFVNTEDSLEPAPISNTSENVPIPCVMVRASVFRDPRLMARGGFAAGQAPGHSNPDGPSFCIIRPATMGPAGAIDFQSLIEGLPGQFTDPDFKQDSSSLFVDPRMPMAALARRRIVWKRPEELSQEPALFLDGAEPGDIIQGQLGDCYLLSSAAILASSKSAHLLRKLFVKTQYFKKGLVGMRFFKDGRWIDVVVDTAIPCYDGARAQPCFVHMKDPGEFWMIMLEKAYAKVHGCYEALDGGFMNEALADMTGGAPGRVKVTDLFRAVNTRGMDGKLKALQLLKNRAHGELLQGASSDAGGQEETLGNGLYSGHAYSINDARSTSTGEVLVQLRNPWGAHEWKGAWSDGDTARWTPQMKAELNHTDEDDGMFWMSVEDFIRCFTQITYVDLVPHDFCSLRVLGRWTRETGGGCVNHQTWKNNPMILMTVPQKCSITIQLDQRDTRMQCKQLGKAGFDALYNGRSGYDRNIGFSVLRGNRRKTYMSRRDIVDEANYTNLRSVSCHLPNCEPGDYIIVPTTFDPVSDLQFYMRFFSSVEISLTDTRGGQDVQIFSAAEDQIDKKPVPLSIAADLGLISTPDPKENPPPEEDIDYHPVVLHDDGGQEAFKGLLSDLGSTVKHAIWRVGEVVPVHWRSGTDFNNDASNEFVMDEIAAIARSDRTVRFCKVSAVNPGPTYNLDVSLSPSGPLQKVNVPPQYICKLKGVNGIPEELANQIGSIFDILDADGSGALDAGFDSPEVSGDLAKRLLLEMGVNSHNFQEQYKALRELDANGDGLISKQEFIAWFAKKALE